MPTRIPPPPTSVLKHFDAAAALRAVYVDYEGRPHHSPVLLGWRAPRSSGCSIIEPTFSTCAGRWRARHVTEEAHDAVLTRLLEFARDGHHIVSWSRHDYKLMMRVLRHSGQAVLRGAYVNALAVVRPWYHATYGCVHPGGYSLSNMRQIFGLGVAAHYGDGVVGTTLAKLQQRFESGKRYGDLTPEERAGWVAVVKHNRFDIDHMREIVVRIKRQTAPGA